MFIAWNRTDFVASVNANEIPRRGIIEIHGLGATEYFFHGRGCDFTYVAGRIDIEICSDGKSVGFDAWRLLRFSEEALGIQDVDSENIMSILRQLVIDGQLMYSDAAPYYGLFFEVQSSPALVAEFKDVRDIFK